MRDSLQTGPCALPPMPSGESGSDPLVVWKKPAKRGVDLVAGGLGETACLEGSGEPVLGSLEQRSRGRWPSRGLRINASQSGIDIVYWD